MIGLMFGKAPAVISGATQWIRKTIYVAIVYMCNKKGWLVIIDYNDHLRSAIQLLIPFTDYEFHIFTAN